MNNSSTVYLSLWRHILQVFIESAIPPSLSIFFSSVTWTRVGMEERCTASQRRLDETLHRCWTQLTAHVVRVILVRTRLEERLWVPALKRALARAFLLL